MAAPPCETQTLSQTTEVPAAKDWSRCFRAQMRNTQMCRFYAKGKCRYGSCCMFAHTQGDLKNPPDLLKTSLCTKWAEGHCPFDAELCPFAHGREELRRTAAFQRKRGKAAQKKVSATAKMVDEASCDGSSVYEGSTVGTASTTAGGCTPTDDNTDAGFQSDCDDTGFTSPWISEDGYPQGSQTPTAYMGEQMRMPAYYMQPWQGAVVTYVPVMVLPGTPTAAGAAPSEC